MRRGSSGASITCVGDDVTKRQLDSPRVREQGEWLQRHTSRALPRVARVYEESYVMERLAVPPVGLLDHRRVLRAMVTQLNTHIWSRRAVVPCNHDMLQTKIERLLERNDWDSLLVRVHKLHASIAWQRLPTCLTHGDPTFDNVMIRESTGELVLADPIPATLVIPDLRCVDIGKIMQSIVGWEVARYGSEAHRFNVTVEDLGEVLGYMPQHDDNEWRASIFWCLVHLLRVTPYVDDVVRTRVRKLIGDTIALL